jgi:endoglycosylceramidase
VAEAGDAGDRGSAPSEAYLPAGGFPDGGVVEGGEVVSWDPELRILRFTIDGGDGGDGGAQTVVVRPR